MTASPNQYGMMALRHMQDYLPQRYGAIRDPASYFAQVGEEVLREINAITAGWERTRPAEMADAGRRNMARMQAEEMVLSELVYLPPEPDPAEPEIDENGGWVGAEPGTEWVSMRWTQEDQDAVDAAKEAELG